MKNGKLKKNNMKNEKLKKYIDKRLNDRDWETQSYD